MSNNAASLFAQNFRDVIDALGGLFISHEPPEH